MLIDKYLNTWDYAKKNEILVDTQSVPTISTFYTLDFSRSWLIRTLFFLRGLPQQMLTLKGMLDVGFILLEESQEEIVFGLISQPWKWNGQIMNLPPEEFASFSNQDYIKIVWNFRFEPTQVGRLRISTETRIQCLSSQTNRKFARYWFFVRFFSGLIRKEMLKMIKKEYFSWKNR